MTELWRFLPWGYAVSVLLEAPILLAALSRRHSLWRRLAAAAWLTGCTYPIVALTLPALMFDRFSHAAFLAVAETFAPLAECGLFHLAFHRGAPGDRRADWQDYAAIVAANLFSFLSAEAARYADWIAW